MRSETMQEFVDSVESGATVKEKEEALRLADEARHRLGALSTPLPPPPVELHPFAAGTITDEWIAATLQHKVDRQRIIDESNLLRGLLKEAENRAQLITPDTNAILRAYHKRLTQLLDEVADIAEQLDGVDTADKAIAADRGPEWRKLLQLADDYQVLRRAQLSVVPDEVIRSAKGQDGEELASDLFVRNLDDIWPTWRQPYLTPGQTKHVHTGHVDRVEPWPEGAVPQLLWLATSEAQPWIPMIPEVQQLLRKRRDRINGTPKPLGPRPDKVPTPQSQQWGGHGSMAESFIYGRLSPKITAVEPSSH